MCEFTYLVIPFVHIPTAIWQNAHLFSYGASVDEICFRGKYQSICQAENCRITKKAKIACALAMKKRVSFERIRLVKQDFSMATDVIFSSWGLRWRRILECGLSIISETFLKYSLLDDQVHIEMRSVISFPLGKSNGTSSLCTAVYILKRDFSCFWKSMYHNVNRKLRKC